MSNLFQKYLKGDRIIWGIIFLLAVASLLTVYSATGSLAYKNQGGNTTYYMFKQLVFLTIGIGLIVLVHRIPYKYFARFAVVLLYLSILLLLVTLITGSNLNEASRWLALPGIGISFQPSELAKISLIFYVARVLAHNQSDEGIGLGAFKQIMFHTGVVCLLILPENLSTAALLGLIVMTMMFLGQVPLKYLFLTGVGGAVIITVVLLLSMNGIVLFERASTWSARVERFFNENEEGNEDDPGSYQVTQSKIAIATGCIIGKVPGNSDQRNFLPHPYSDFIYAIIAEEFGLVGAIIILFAYLFLLARVGVLVQSSHRTFPAFMAVGLGLMLVSQSFVNMGVAVGIFPVTGQPLPLVSMGGTSILFSCVAFGAILSVSRQNIEEKENQKLNKQGLEDDE